jgi:hypothetical protein
MLNKDFSGIEYLRPTFVVSIDPPDPLHQALDVVQEDVEWGVHNYCTYLFDCIEVWIRRVFYR